jgi:CBS domain-containing protein
MTENIVALESNEPVKKAAELVDKHDIGYLIVVDKGEPVGIVTERDMLKRVLLQFKDPRITGVSDVMSAPLIASASDTDLNKAVRLMNERRIKKLVVVEDGVLVGLLSTTDVVRSLAFFEHTIKALCSRRRWNENPRQQVLGKEEALAPSSESLH